MGRLILVMLVGFVFLAVGLFLLRNTMSLTHVAVRAEGTVIEQQRSRDSKGRVSYRPVVRFAPTEGEPVEFVSGVGSSSPPAIGTRVTVLYDPHDPQHAEIDSYLSLWFGPLAFGGIGALLILFPMGRAVISILRFGILG